MSGNAIRKAGETHQTEAQGGVNAAMPPPEPPEKLQCPRVFLALPDDVLAGCGGRMGIAVLTPSYGVAGKYGAERTFPGHAACFMMMPL